MFIGFLYILICRKVPLMPRFFVTKNQIDNDTVTLTGDDAHHISRSLRMAAGERITVCDMQKNEYECILEDFLEGKVTARIESRRQSDIEPPFCAHLYQALPKGEKLDSVIQKSVECGVSSVTTFISERCIAKEGSNEEKKLQRRARIALEAAKQSGRAVLPEVNPTVSFKEAIERAANADIALFCYEGDMTEPLGSALRRMRASIKSEKAECPDISIVIGSEGGFSLAEAEYARRMGLTPVGLGKRILRTETASSFALACIVCEFEL